MGEMRQGGVIIYKLLAVDIDGTLITTDMKLTGVTRRAIARAQERGLRVTLATGRSFRSALNYAQQLDIDLPLICANGALIIDRKGNVLQESALPGEVAAQLLTEMVEAGFFVQAYHDQGIFSVGPPPNVFQWIRAICGDKPKLSHILYSFREYRRCAITHKGDLPKLLAQGQVRVHKLFCSGPLEAQDYFQDRASERGLTVEFYPQGSRMYLEIMAANVSKGNALKVVARSLGVPMAETIAVGDNLNDLSMVEMAGLGVAMGNGHPRLKQAADFVTDSNDQDGVAVLIQQVLTPADDRPAM